MTVGDALRLATQRLARAGVADPAWDAELLLRHVLRWDRAALLAREAMALTADDEVLFFALVTQREGRRPLQHLTGTQAFYGREFLVSPDVLIPRPETELLVEAALELVSGVAAPVVVDVGTGTGCIALTIAAENPAARVHATDISPAALEVARDNAWRLRLEGRVVFYQGDLMSPVADLAGSVHLVASNPPYVHPSDISALPPEVRDHDPRQALIPVPDAPALYRRLVAGARDLLRPGGALVVEIGQGMADEVAAICEGEGLRVERVILDLQGIPRVVMALRPQGSQPFPPRVD
jgi:release factor glutamine methyltransferase